MTLDSVIVLLYLTLCGASFVQMARILVNWHSVWGFHFPFLLLCFAFGVLRVAFFLCQQPGSELVTTFLFWYPINVQFAAFALVVVYQANVLYKRNWEDVRKPVYALYLIVNLLMHTVSCSFLMSCTGAFEMTEPLERMYHLCLAIHYLLLTAAYCGCGRLLDHASPSATSLGASQSVKVTRVAAAVFASRALYNSLAWMAVFSLELGQRTAPESVLGLYSFVCMVVWEIVPTLMVLWFFRDIPKAESPLGVRHIRAYCCPCWPAKRRRDKLIQSEMSIGYGSRDQATATSSQYDRSSRNSMADEHEENEEFFAGLETQFLNHWTAYEPSSRAIGQLR